ncbi:MAG TPA: DUF4185 domain-containing protein [Polyangiales bacterium]|nr:DUF4185 domain-containing protein [Polyangiales bacterium]
MRVVPSTRACWLTASFVCCFATACGSDGHDHPSAKRSEESKPEREPADAGADRDAAGSGAAEPTAEPAADYPGAAVAPHTDNGAAPAHDAADGGEAPAPKAGAAGARAPEPEPEPEPVKRPFFSTVAVADGYQVRAPSNGDLWPGCWSDDDAFYVAAGDGTGFGLVPSDIAVSRVLGRPGDRADPLRGSSIALGADVAPVWSGTNYNRKPTGMLCQKGELYLAVQDLRRWTFTDAPAATIVKSVDKGRTWTWDDQAPMFRDYVFTTVMFLDFGKDSEHAPDDYVYAYGLDDNWSFETTRTPPTKLYLARVSRDGVQDRSRWQFFAGYDADAPRWTEDIGARAPVLEDTRRLYAEPLDPELIFQNMPPINQGGVVYNAPLKRYIYSSWTEYTFELYEAPAPWGPWTHFYSKDFGVFPWNEAVSGGYGTTIPSKFIAADGREMWLQSAAWLETGADNYAFSLRRVRVTPFTPSEPNNERSSASLATPARFAVPLTRVLRQGDPSVLHDGEQEGQSADSRSGERKTQDFWGYTWPNALRLNTLRYTTGNVSAAGGWLEQLAVQVRRGTEWVPVEELSIMPRYTESAELPAHTTFTLRFADTVTDGVRIVGRPGGTQSFSSIAELAASFE